MRDDPPEELAMLRQPFVPIKTKRVWFNETGAGVVHARLGRGATEGGRAFPPFIGFPTPSRSRPVLLLTGRSEATEAGVTWC